MKLKEIGEIIETEIRKSNEKEIEEKDKEKNGKQKEKNLKQLRIKI